MASSASLSPNVSSSSGTAKAAAMADLFTLKCETGFVVAGLQDGEAECTPVRVFCTLVAMSVVSAWVSQQNSIKVLLLFFSHWLRCVGVLSNIILGVYAFMLLCLGCHVYIRGQQVEQTPGWVDVDLDLFCGGAKLHLHQQLATFPATTKRKVYVRWNKINSHRPDSRTLTPTNTHTNMKKDQAKQAKSTHTRTHTHTYANIE